MAGTLFGLPLSQQMDDNGDPQSGCLLYIYAALTSTPSDTYADSGLSTLNAFPMEADASGRIPQFWVNDGSYRARLTTAGGVEIFDEDNILAIGPSVASTGGGGGGDTGDSTGILSTGDMKWKPVSGTESGWVRSNARTIGSASSGATERASSDTQSLYEFLWNNFDNATCPVTTGRGGTALADFAANKAIGTLDMRGRTGWGVDDMGNSAADVLTGGTDEGTSGGDDTSVIVQANIPNYNLSSASLTGIVSSQTINNGTNVVRTLDNADFGTFNAGPGGHGVFDDLPSVDQSTLTLNDPTVTIGGSVPSGGTGDRFATMPPYVLGTWYMKL